MSAVVTKLINDLKDPIKEMNMIRHGLKPNVVKSFLHQENLAIDEVLDKLNIPSSTFFGKGKSQKLFNPHESEKFIRLIHVMVLAASILGNLEAKDWLYRNIPSLGNEVPISLLDTETGHRLVEQALLQIKYGIYG